MLFVRQLHANYEKARSKTVFVTTPAAFVIGIVLATSGKKKKKRSYSFQLTRKLRKQLPY